jgi:hypothetical protein
LYLILIFQVDFSGLEKYSQSIHSLFLVGNSDLFLEKYF